MPKIPIARYRLARKQICMAKMNLRAAEVTSREFMKQFYIARAESQMQAAKDFRSGARKIHSSYSERFISSWV